MKKYSQKDIESVARVLSEGEIVAVPTETVYGLAVNLESVVATKRLLTLKERPVGGDKVLTLMLASIGDLDKYVLLDNKLRKLLAGYFPGELTAVLEKNPEFRHDYFASYDKIGVRIPKHEFILKLLALTGPLLVTSANLRGETSGMDSERVAEDLGGKIDAVVEGRAGGAPASTVADFTMTPPKILRQGRLKI